MSIIRSFAVLLVGLIASVLTIINFFAERVAPTSKVDLNAVLSLFVIASFGGIIWQEIRYRRRSRYAGVMQELGQIYLEIQTLPGGYTASRDEIREGCRLVVNRLAKAMTDITGKKCSACIKTIASKKFETRDRPCVVTLCRDDSSIGREKRAKKVKHWIDENFDFEQLHKMLPGSSDSFFLRNFLPGVRNYKNTSFQIYGQPSNSRVPFVRAWSWRLPYKSTIVVPISPRPDKTSQKHKLVGYLCVDSPSWFVFKKKDDAELVMGIANCLYEIVYLYGQAKPAGKGAARK